MKLNCWEFHNCGREPGGKSVSELGVCPAAFNQKANGINAGKNGGRACWALAGTFCNGEIQATYAKKVSDCMHCSFYQQVFEEEGMNLVPAMEIHEIIQNETTQELISNYLSERRKSV